MHGRQASREVSPAAVAAPVPSDGPTLVERYDDGTIKSEEWYVGEVSHRADGPAHVRYYPDGSVEYEAWHVDDKHHRIDGPAVVGYRPDGTIKFEEWLVDDKHHRIDGPAVVWYHPDGTVESEAWFVDGEPHRTDGPANVQYHPDGTVESETWFVDGTGVEPWEVLGRYLRRRGVSGLSAEALRQIAKDVPWQRWDELGSDHPLVALWGTVHPSADISAD